METFMNFLRKLGILRYGATKAKYTSMKDMPDELFMPNVYDSKKDLLHKSDLQGPHRRTYWFIFICMFFLAIAVTLMIFGSPKQMQPTLQGMTGTVLPQGTSETSSAVKILEQPATPAAVRLAPCTSKISDQPKALPGWSIHTYAAQRISPTPDPEKATKTRQFSLSALKAKTSPETLYVQIRRDNNGLLTGYDTALELCNAKDEVSFVYATANHDASDILGTDITAREHSIHGGAYAWEPGIYRADVYIRDLQGVWHLVQRETGIQIVE